MTAAARDSATTPAANTPANAAANAGPRPLYLDYQATTPVDPRVAEVMLPWIVERFGNPHSAGHALGWEAEEAVEAARAQVAALIGAEPREIVFTSGATEANNLAIKGALRFRKAHEDRDGVVTLASEHKCVLESARAMEREGARVTVLPVGADGLLELERLEAVLDERTALVSVMAVNNEIGVIQPLAEIARLCHAKGVWLHSDAAQAAGKTPLDVRALDLDLVSLSGHKLYGPKGIGALFVRRRPRIRLEPLFDGGGQERGLRSGTLAPFLCVGFGKAAELAAAELPAEAQRLWLLHRRLRQRLAEAVPEARFNGHPERRVPGNLNVAFPGVEAQALLRALPDLALSTGSACTSAEVEPSYVLRALGLPDDLAGAAIRIGLGRMTTVAEVDRAATLIAAAVTRLRAAA